MFPERLKVPLQQSPRMSRRTGKSVAAISGICLTGTQVWVHNALVAALLEPSALIVLTGDASLGKTSVLAAALASISDPLLQTIAVDAGECGFDHSFNLLFTAARMDERGIRRAVRKIVLVADQAEALPSGTFAYLELLTRMPGKDASVQLIIVGRPEFRVGTDNHVAERFQSALPVHLVLSPLSEQDAWELFHRRVSSVGGTRSVRRIIMMLLERCDGMPGRFDQALKAAVADGLLQGAPA